MLTSFDPRAVLKAQMILRRALMATGASPFPVAWQGDSR